jgi:hypothetical protein
MVIEGLDPDEGIRILGSLDGSEKGFIFVTKPSGLYIINICEKVYDEALHAMVPGGKEDWSYIATPNNVWKVIETKIKKPLEAWLY